MTITHRMSDTPTYKTWLKMKERCTNPNATQWKWYGGKGIVICERWLTSFEAFLSDMGERPDGLSIDRIDNTRGYEPGNCRWATHLQQIHNQDKTILVDLHGEQVPLTVACDRIGVPISTVYSRMRRGMAFEEARQPEHLRETKTPERLREYAEMRLARKTHAEIAAIFGMAEGSLEKWATAARAEGLLPRRRITGNPVRRKRSRTHYQQFAQEKSAP